MKKRGKKRTFADSEDAASNSPGPSTPFTRSATTPLAKCHRFICQLASEDLIALRTDNAGKALRNAVEISQNSVLMTRLNNAISPSDAHAIDVLYHKSCRRKNVFHVLQNEAARQSQQARPELPMQIPCLIELINLIDFQTKNQAYLPMDDMEAMYISLLGGKEEAEKHTPKLTRKWLKDKILS